MTKWLRALARGTSLVALGLALGLLFPDAHANASGNREVAATIAAWLGQSPAAPGT